MEKIKMCNFSRWKMLYSWTLNICYLRCRQSEKGVLYYKLVPLEL